MRKFLLGSIILLTLSACNTDKDTEGITFDKAKQGINLSSPTQVAETEKTVVPNNITELKNRIDADLKAPMIKQIKEGKGNMLPVDENGKPFPWHTLLSEEHKEEARELKKWITSSGKNVTQQKLKEAFLEACRDKNQYAVKVLLDAGIDVSKEELEQIIVDKVLYSDNSAEESDKDISEVMELLLNAGATANGRALKEASNLGFTEVVKTLLASGISDKEAISEALLYPNEYNAGDTAEIVKALLAAGADPNVKHKQEGYSALWWVSVFMPDAEAVEALLAAGAEPNTTDEEGKTILQLTKNEEIVQLLKSYGAKE
ncbi:MAG: hypothetical protein MJ053_00030 [Elusimicrobiaceae bacterium]|nr:hypothetical protein [Elusimicrobiaceae bacterium]